MLKLCSTVLLALLIATGANAQLNLSLVGQLNYETEFGGSRGDCSDIWGYVTPGGHEYAIVGNQNGTSIVDISTDPSNPTEVFYSPGATTIWRDMKVYGTTAYITNEGDNGLKIIDLSNLPGPITSADVYQFTGSTYPFTTAHNIFIDVPAGRCYITGADNGVGGAIILDLTQDQLNPVELGRYDDYYMHDIYVRNDTLWGGAINDGFFTVVDVSDPSNCVTLATQITPSTFSHNVWLSDDGNVLYTTDEVADAYIAAYDVSDLNNITELDRIQSSPGENVIPHNVFVHNSDFLITSYYRDGVTIHDCSNPNNLVEVGFYDTSPAFDGDGFNGCWGVYPYLPSGLIIASDIENGCFVLDPTYVPASFLEGTITDASNANPINNAIIDIAAATVTDNSDLSGNYLTGVATAGTYDVTYSKLGYITQTVTNVSLTSGNTTTVDVQLVPQVTFTLQGVVLDTNNNPIPNAEVLIRNAQQTLTTTTNGLGEFDFNGFLTDVYDVIIGSWGYHTICLPNQLLDDNSGVYTYELEEGYSDQFDIDLGWTVSGNANTGDWERGVPNGTTYIGIDANPGEDSQDCGEMAFVTGNAGGQAGNDDIDGGETVLSSPLMDLSSYSDPYMSFERWFFNAGGSGTPNDSLVIELSNGTQSAVIDQAIFNDPNTSEWAFKEIRVLDYLPLSGFMQLKARAMDENGGHLVEAGFDNFFVRDSVIDVTQISEVDAIDFNVYPNPFQENITLTWGGNYEQVTIQIIEPASGRIVDVLSVQNSSSVEVSPAIAKGLYLIQLSTPTNTIATKRLIKL
jgi:choice-of-anchor B domain-containing protein